jgi:hypothetical protein
LCVTAGYKKGFTEYLRGLGLADKQKKLSEDTKKAIAKKAHSIAARIIAMDKKRKK